MFLEIILSTIKQILYYTLSETIKGGEVVLKKNINVEIGQRVKVARQNANLTREMLAEKLNVSTLFISYIECGQKGMSLETLQRLCYTLNVSSDYILLGRNDAEISKNNLQLLIDSIDPRYYSVIEKQIICFMNCMKEIEYTIRKDTSSDMDY